MDNDRFDSGDFEEDEVAHHLANERRVIHGRPSHFDEKGFSAKALKVRQGFNEHGGFFGGGGHAPLVSGSGAA